MSIITVGIDLAKNIFAVHGVDEYGKAVLVKPKVAREQLPSLVAQHASARRLSPSLTAPPVVRSTCQRKPSLPSS